MNKLRLKSNFGSANLNPSNFWPFSPDTRAKTKAGAWINQTFVIISSITLISHACPGQLWAKNAAEKSAAEGSAYGRAVASSCKQALTIRVIVKNPRCPACFRTLKTYLLAIKGVLAVSVLNGSKREKETEIIVSVKNKKLIKPVISRIKAHDLEILRRHFSHC